MYSMVVEELVTLEAEVSRALAHADYTAMTHDERVTFLQHKERIIRRLQNADNQLIPVLTQENTPAAFGYKNTRQLLQNTLLVSGPDAGARVAAACELGPRTGRGAGQSRRRARHPIRRATTARRHDRLVEPGVGF